MAWVFLRGNLHILASLRTSGCANLAPKTAYQVVLDPAEKRPQPGDCGRNYAYEQEVANVASLMARPEIDFAPRKATMTGGHVGPNYAYLKSIYIYLRGAYKLPKEVI
jgi:hypothetical protein